MNVKRKLKRSSHRLDQMVPASDDTVTQSVVMLLMYITWFLGVVMKSKNILDLHKACFGLHMGVQWLVELIFVLQISLGRNTLCYSIVSKVCVNVWCFQENSELSSAEYFPVSQDRRRTGYVVGGLDTNVELMV